MYVKTFFGGSHPEDGFIKKGEKFGGNDFLKLSFNSMCIIKVVLAYYGVEL